MEIEKLRYAWNQLSSQQASINELGDKEILGILNSRARSTIDRINRNITIGSFILFFLLVVFPVMNASLNNAELEIDASVPKWINLLGILGYVLVLIFYFLFIFSYYRVRKSCRIACNLRTTLIKTIRILKIYFRLFGLVFIIVFFVALLEFSLGFFKGAGLETASPAGILIGMIFLFVILGSATGLLFLLFRWGFRRLYGKYLDNLKQTLKELDEK